MADTVQSRALQRAARLLGGVEALRLHLGVPMLHLLSWMEGKSRPPDAIFLRVVDLLANEPGANAAREPAQ